MAKKPQAPPKKRPPATKAKAKIPRTQPRTRVRQPTGTKSKVGSQTTAAVPNAWKERKKTQENIVKVVKNSRIIIFGAKETGKTHVLESAALNPHTETERFIYKELRPLRIIDCGNAAETIVMKDFYEEYQRGDILIMRATIHHTSGEILTEPTDIIANVRQMIEMCEKETTGAIGIDEFDKIEEWCRVYIYRNHGMYEKPNGELWYRKKVKMIKGKEIVEPERRAIRIPRWMYGPRNTQIRKILGKLTHINIPVILVAHEGEEYNKISEEPTGKIIPNLRPFVGDFADLIVRFENYESEVVKETKGKISIGLEDTRRMISIKNRLQKGKSPERKIVEQDSFEFSDVFSIILGDTNGKEKTTKEKPKKVSTKKICKKTSRKKTTKKTAPKKR